MAKTRNNNKLDNKEIQDFRRRLLSWYDKEARDLPWRYKTGRKPDPYKIWLSEIMLQQTTVTAVIPYFLKFIKKWPAIKHLARADIDEVMKEWAGLGYYARARNLHKCAQIVTNTMDGTFPQEAGELKKLPGIGEYTSAAIVAIAFDKPANVVDGNVERVMARIFACRKPLPDVKKYLAKKAAVFSEGFTDRPGDFAQSLMELGATVCVPQSPRCGSCPVSIFCQAKRTGQEGHIPRVKKKKIKPKKFGYVYLIENNDNCILLERRPQTGLLGGMTALPTSSWLEQKEGLEESTPQYLLECRVENISSQKMHVKHGFTHFDLHLELVTGKINKTSRILQVSPYIWAKIEDLDAYGFPSVFQKALKQYL